jgi:GNAT superfamily N-acetyltransferase
VPLVLIASLVNGKVVAYSDEALSRDLQEILTAHIAEIEFPNINPLLDVLKNHNVQFDVGHYKTYVFPSIPVNHSDVHCLLNDDTRVKAFGFDGFAERVYAIELEGKVVSACVSARENGRCGEAWVYTAPDHRHQGLAQKVVSTWAGSLKRAGKIPFYSHKIDNLASANLAGKLGLQSVFEEIAIARV